MCYECKTLSEKREPAWRILIVFLVLVSMTLVSIFAFDELVVPTITLNVVFLQTIRVLIVLATTGIAIFVIRRMKKAISSRTKTTIAAFFEFVMIAILLIMSSFSLLHIFNVDTNTLLISGGIISITVGLVVSTFVGDTLAGMLVFLLNLYRIGDAVLVNSVPCRVEEMSTLVTRFRNDAGGMLSIPNTAISQGGVIITRFPELKNVATVSRLPYEKGDRVYTTYMNAEGVVVALDSIHTRIRLDAGMEISFLNNSVLSGTVAVAKIVDEHREAKKTEKI
jgi:small-conductance mechanosensitive channel